MEITVAEQNKEKRMKINADSLRNLGQCQMHYICKKTSVSAKRRKTRERIEDHRWKLLYGKQQTSPWSYHKNPTSLIKEEFPKNNNNNQDDKNWRQRKNY